MNKQNWSRAKLLGYEDYYAGADCNENPFDIELESWQWDQWCDGHLDAYCEDEGK